MAGRDTGVEMKREWLLVAGDFTLSGGMDRANYHLAWHLAERTDSLVRLVSHRVAEPLATHPRVEVHRVRRPLGRHFLGAACLNRAGRRLARERTRANPHTRVVVNGGNCLWPGINWVHMVHHACPRADAGAPLAFTLKNRLARAWARRAERAAFAQAQVLIANSEKTRQDLITHLNVPPERIAVVYLGVDAEKFGPVSAVERAAARRQWGVGDALTLVFVGALGYDRNKGLDTLLDACLRLRRRVPPFRLLAAGNGALDSWRREVERRGLGEQVRLVGQVQDMPGLLAAADLLVSPTRYDAYGLAVHEAICREVPAVVSGAAGIAERFPAALQRLILRDVNDPDELAERIVDALVEREDCREAVARLGAEWRAHTWDGMAEAMQDAVERAAESSARLVSHEA
jgi:glycosyltransferase involved in cell wall biosynthesis